MSIEQVIEENTAAIYQLAAVVDKLNAAIASLNGAPFTTGDKTVIDLTQTGPVEEKQPVKKETPPKSTKKVTAADIVETKTEVKAEEPALEVEEEVSLTDEEPKKLEVDFENEDFEALRTECRVLINSAVDRVGKPEVVRILKNFDAKSLKDVTDVSLKFLKFELLSAK